VKKDIISFIILPDFVASKIYLRFFHEKNSLIIVTFHVLFRSEKEIALDLVDSRLGITVEKFRQFVEYFLNHDYTFISQNNILNGLDNNKKYIMITFDDGYFNNQYSLPILNEYQVPATFFISTNHVKNNRCFWWDVLYRERRKLGRSLKDITCEQNHLKLKRSEDIQKILINLLGKTGFRPISDIDRPFTPSELKDFSQEKYVFIGNHTSDHSILTNYSSNEIKLQLLNAQKTIYDITGITPILISYPDGNYSNEVIRISKEMGFKLGFTVYPKKNYLPIDIQTDGCMELNRFDLVDDIRLVNQCELFRSDIITSGQIRNLLRRRYYK
jgi:peptidoglycan/xylan/chitin deacetylase (PgdA/CDA1 family)